MPCKRDFGDFPIKKSRKMQKVFLTPRTLRELGLYFSQVFPLVSLNYPPTMSPKAPYLGNTEGRMCFFD